MGSDFNKTMVHYPQYQTTADSFMFLSFQKFYMILICAKFDLRPEYFKLHFLVYC